MQRRKEGIALGSMNGGREREKSNQGRYMERERDQMGVKSPGGSMRGMAAF